MEFCFLYTNALDNALSDPNSLFLLVKLKWKGNKTSKTGKLMVSISCYLVQLILLILSSKGPSPSNPEHVSVKAVRYQPAVIPKN